jgi:predicted DNA binding CopG/RHH family protein
VQIRSNNVEAVKQELRCDPLASLKETQEQVNARLEREDLTEANMKAAMEQISYSEIRDAVLSQLASGKAHYQESYLFQFEMILIGSTVRTPSPLMGEGWDGGDSGVE